MKLKQFLSGILALLFVVSLPVSALALDWDISKGDITVNAGSGGQTVTQGSQVDVSDPDPVIKGSTTENTVTINAEKDQTASVTLSGANIDVSGKSEAAVQTTGDGSVSIELNGDSTLKSGSLHAGLEKNNGGSLTIGDADNNGKLTAEGGKYGAGIGGGNNGAGSDITITGGEVNATGGYGGAGIGGGDLGDGSDITITGGEVNATGGNFSAGIGGGLRRKGNDITVSGDAKLKVQGGVKDNWDGAGAGIGNGGSSYTNGAEVEPDICALKSSGKIEYYAPGTPMSGAPTKTVTNPTEDHVWDSGTETKPATCTEKGFKTYTCTKHPSVTKTVDIPALNHSFVGQEYVSNNDATCEQDGTKTAKCVRYGTGGCMETDTVTDTGSKLGHFFKDYVSDNNATCEQDGTKTGKCVRYGKGGCMETDTVPDTGSKLGHLFEDYVSDNNATYESDGTKTAKCVRYDQCGQTHTITDVGSRLKISPLYRVTDKDGRNMAYTAEQAGGVLTVTVDADFAILTGNLSNIRTLKAQGVEKIVFVTKGAASAFALADLLESGSTGKTYQLTHDGKTVTFTLGEDKADVSAILTQP